MLKRETTQMLLIMYWKTFEMEFHRNQIENDVSCFKSSLLPKIKKQHTQTLQLVNQN
jgi:hypothetical protein